MATPYNQFVNKFKTPWDPPDVEEDMSQATKFTMPVDPSAITNVNPEEETISGQYVDPLDEIKGNYLSQYRQPVVKDYSDEFKNQVQNAGSLKDLMGLLSKSANMAGSVQGKAAPEYLSGFLDKSNKDMTGMLDTRKAEADKSLERQDLAADKFLKYSNAPYEQRMLSNDATTSDINLGRERFKEESYSPELIQKLKNIGLPVSDSESVSQFAAKNPAYKAIIDDAARREDARLAQQKLGVDMEKARLSAGNAQEKAVRIPQMDRNKLQDRSEAIYRAQEAAKIAQNVYTGLGSSLIPDIARTSKGAEAQSAILQMTNAYNNMISGGAITPSEAERLRKAMPNMGDTPENFKAKMVKYLQDLNNINSLHLQQIENEGYDATPYKTQPTEEPQPEMNVNEFNVGQVVEANDGRKYKFNGKDWDLWE